MSGTMQTFCQNIALQDVIFVDYLNILILSHWAPLCLNGFYLTD